MFDFTQARINMVDSQVRPNGVTDHRIIAAMLDVPREAFVDESAKAIAYVDDDLLIEASTARYMMEPMNFARLLQLAEIKQSDRVLVVGAGTGYGAAVLSRIAANVTALEEDAGLAAKARNALAEYGVSLQSGPHAKGWAAGKPYDVIVVEGRIESPPHELLAQLAESGRLVAVMGPQSMARCCLWTQSGAGVAHRTAFDAAVALLPGFEAHKPSFVFA